MRAARLSRLALGAALLAAASSVAGAVDGPTETLKTLYRVALSADMCGFPIAQRQSEALGRAMNRALSESGLDPDAADRLYLDVDEALEAEGWDKICAANGEWARSWNALLAANGK
ncbi:MAG: hypothetical protein GX458_09605 [Phyllobacteriaceae bacterium]|nr:hypothetical protein [Phyllobacteriaceae bacterium]